MVSVAVQLKLIDVNHLYTYFIAFILTLSKIEIFGQSYAVTFVSLNVK